MYGNAWALSCGGPAGVDAMSLWQYMAAIDGYERGNSPDGAKADMTHSITPEFMERKKNGG